MPVRSRALSFTALDTHHDSFLGPSEIAASDDDFGSGSPATPRATPGILKRIDTNDRGRISQTEFFAAESLIAGTAQLLTLQSEENAPSAPTRHASAGHDYDTAAASSIYAPPGTFVVAAA